MQFIKTRDVKDPVRDVKENAGIDFFIPENTADFAKAFKEKNKEAVVGDVADLREFRDETGRDWPDVYYNTSSGVITISPQCAVIIPTGIKSKFGPELALIANNKSGIATKKQLIFGASVIDCSYQGEWHINLINTSKNFQTLECGQKAVQFIPHLISTDPVEIVDMTEEEFYTKKTSRGDGWQGSTGVK